MSPPPKPVGSPTTKDEVPDTPSGVYRTIDGKLVDVTNQLREEAETRQKLAHVEAEGLVAHAVKALHKQGGWALAFLLFCVAAASITVYGQTMDKVEKKATEAGRDAGEKVVRDVVQEQKYLRQDVDHLTKKSDRQEKLLELVARKLKVSETAIPDPVPEPPPRDAGR